MSEHEDSTTPTLVALWTEDCKHFKVWCKYCETWHYHGPMEGPRQAHCEDAASPYLRTGYDLRVADVRADGELDNLTLDLGDFYTCWHWLREHPYFFHAPAPALTSRLARYADNEPGFEESLSIIVAQVDPESHRVERDEHRNTETQVWLECGPWVTPDEHDDGSHKYSGYPCHDVDLDEGAETFERAIRNLAEKVMMLHGSYPAYRHCSHCLRRLPAGTTDPEREWFCSNLCAEHGTAELVTEPVPGNEGVVKMVPWEEVFDCEHWPKSNLDEEVAMPSSGEQ